LLQAAKIVDPASQQHALAAIQAVAAIVGAILALVQSISSKAQVAQMAARSTIKLAAVQPYLDDYRAARIVAVQYSEPLELAQLQLARAEQMQAQAGF
jgi:cytochrome bd-type quinol oxidase subunit 1